MVNHIVKDHETFSIGGIKVTGFSLLRWVMRRFTYTLSYTRFGVLFLGTRWFEGCVYGWYIIYRGMRKVLWGFPLMWGWRRQGTPKEMNHALNQVLGTLPPGTKVYVSPPLVWCWHSRVMNIPFRTPNLRNLFLRPRQFKTSSKNAKRIVWQQGALQSQTKRNGMFSWDLTYLAHPLSFCSSFTPDIPLSCNCWLQDPEILKATGESDPVDVIGKLRELKNNFR